MSSLETHNRRGPKRGEGAGAGSPRPGRRWLLAAAILLPSVVASALYAYQVTRPVETPDKLLEKAGYVVLTPPSRFHVPGTLITIETLWQESSWPSSWFRRESHYLHPTCEVNTRNLLESARESDTVDQQVTQSLSQSFDVSSKVRSRLESGTQARSVKSVNLKFDNMRILLMSHEKLFQLQNEMVSGTCGDVIKHNLSHGADVCQTEAVLQADMVYSIEYDEGVSSDQQADLTKAIASTVHLEGGHSGSNQVTGEGLFFGIRMKSRCIELPGAV